MFTLIKKGLFMKEAIKMKKLAIITLYKSTCDFHKQELESIFEDFIEIETYSLNQIEDNFKIETDLVMTSYHEIFNRVKKKIKEGTDIVIMQRTITIEGLNKLKELTPNTRVMLVNVNAILAMEVIAQIYELGVKDVDFVPVYPGMENIPDINIAVTPGEVKYVPDNVSEIINIKNRIIDFKTIIDLTEKLNFNLEKTQKIINNYMEKIDTISYGIRNILKRSYQLQEQLETILQITNDGIIAVNTSGIITAVNEVIEKIIGQKRNQLLGKNVDKAFPVLELEKALLNRNIQKKKLLKIKNRDIVASNFPLEHRGQLVGAVSICREFYEMESEQQELRKKVIKQGHVARYKFTDIIGQSDAIRNAINSAKKMARSSATILLSGESGTGKELFAQAVHNSSPNKRAPFIAINCSALPENLLESELFGYEEGAFTGASKKGKQGLFELAHGGTIFLDEIGELPLRLQAKLLRVLEEKEIMHVGGSKKIKVNVRIISATNKKLKELVEQKKFRKDLYYRLNVLPLKIPPLKDRKDDIPLLIKSFLQQRDVTLQFSESALDVLKKHKWEGNIRELSNCIEYVIQMTEGKVEIMDLPDYVFTEWETLKLRYKLSEDDIKIINKLKSDKTTLYILQQINNADKNNNNIGRRTIYNNLHKNGFDISELEIRKDILNLQELKLVNVKKGRAGTKITDRGKTLLEVLNGVK